ncbi:MAG: hypothetical protein KGO81_13645 [Bacteroidota bacterium]|nr:hypothetical protein [Bacteroidota bacterium]
MKKFIVLNIYLLCLTGAFAQKINRKELVERHSVVNTKFDSLSSLTIGNGSFAFTVDNTGLQSFPVAYEKGVPLGTESEWGWHSYKDTAHYKFEETLKKYHLNGRDVTYSVQLKEPERNKDAVNWFRQNPHRLQLGNVGFEIKLKNGKGASVNDIHKIQQTLDMWTGEIHSSFTVEGEPVDVFTYCHQQQDAIAVSVQSPLLKENRLSIRLRFPYPTGNWADVGTNYTGDEKHQSILMSDNYSGTIHRILDTTSYWVQMKWSQASSVLEKQKHYFLITPSACDNFQFECRFAPSTSSVALPSFIQTKNNSQLAWKAFWESGGAIDFSGSTDQRAFELERRVVLSQYLIKTQTAGHYPPQETGLTYNSWYGKPHLEMHWWHALHFALWGRIALLEKSLDWYEKVFDDARKIAQRQGYDGVRWQKMTDNQGGESPSSVGAFLIWQQPHIISFAELCYREHHDESTLNKYKKLVFATADWMASFARYDSVLKRYVLGKGVIAAQERFKPEETFNPTYELVYWHWALKTAQQWRERLHLPRDKKWDDVLSNLSQLPVQRNKYLFAESATDSYINLEYRTDHPSVLGALGMLPKTSLVDTSIMKNTFQWIWNNWKWKDTWGWDFPLTAMTATRLGLPEKAIDALLMPIQTNTYLNNGHNYQDQRLTIYLPGNGGLLSAIAVMCAGYDGCTTSLPGIPKDGSWKVRWEGLRKMF